MHDPAVIAPPSLRAERDAARDAARAAARAAAPQRSNDARPGVRRNLEPELHLEIARHMQKLHDENLMRISARAREAHDEIELQQLQVVYLGMLDRHARISAAIASMQGRLDAERDVGRDE